MTETIALPATQGPFLSPRELARFLQVSVDSVYRLAATRALPAYRVLRRILFRQSDIERWLEAHRTEPRDSAVWE